MLERIVVILSLVLAGCSAPDTDENNQSSHDQSPNDVGASISDSGTPPPDTGRTADMEQVCVPNCSGLTCGDDGCGGSCGECEAPQTCTDAGQCACIPSCEGVACGADGCGGTCGTCPEGDQCDAGMCVCIPDCDGRVCGPDGCGGECGACTNPEVCNTRDGVCVDSCTPDCSGRICGDDGCGGSCGDCMAGESCLMDGSCACVPDCVGRACGDDGCGGSCGTCGGAQEVCTDAGACECVPDCAGKVCGSDGCGGVCGTCFSSGSCNAGVCEYPDVSFSTDVVPILETHGCGSMACHGGVQVAAGLDLSSASAVYANLVDQPSTQCTDGRLLVEPGSAATSYLVDKVMGTDLCFGSKMPKTGAGLSAAEIDTLQIWVENGALNN